MKKPKKPKPKVGQPKKAATLPVTKATSKTRAKLRALAESARALVGSTWGVLKVPIYVIGVLGTFLAGMHTILLQIPGVDIAISEALDEKDPFSIKITIKNRVDYTLEDVSSFVGLCQIGSAGGPMMGTYGEDCRGRSRTVIFGAPGWQGHRLIRNDYYEQDLFEVTSPMLGPMGPQIRQNFISADLSIVVFSRPWFEPRWLVNFLSRISPRLVNRDERLLLGRTGAASGKVYWRVRPIDRD